jgi:hypothetical protein
MTTITTPPLDLDDLTADEAMAVLRAGNAAMQAKADEIRRRRETLRRWQARYGATNES